MDFNAKDEYTSINNYKVLQAGFNKLGIDKVRLSMGSYLMLQSIEIVFPRFLFQAASKPGHRAKEEQNRFGYILREK